MGGEELGKQLSFVIVMCTEKLHVYIHCYYPSSYHCIFMHLISHTVDILFSYLNLWF